MTMTLPPLSDPERSLSLAYAPRGSRGALHALWLLDERLGAIVIEPNRPIAAIKLAWWREALERLDTAPPPPEPLLAALAAVRTVGADGRMFARIAAGWDVLIDDGVDGESDADHLLRHARLRGGALFTAAAAMSGGQHAQLEREGALWAAATVPPVFANATVKLEALAALGATGARWPRRLRALGVLSTLGAARLRDPAARVGAPSRIARALWLGLSGR